MSAVASDAKRGAFGISARMIGPWIQLKSLVALADANMLFSPYCSSEAAAIANTPPRISPSVNPTTTLLGAITIPDGSGGIDGPEQLRLRLNTTPIAAATAVPSALTVEDPKCDFDPLVAITSGKR